MGVTNKAKDKYSFNQIARSEESFSDLKIECFLDECVTGLATTNAFSKDIEVTTIQSI